MKKIQGSCLRRLIVGAGTFLALFCLTAVQAQVVPCSTNALDSDGDGIPDIYDNCINVPNADQRDTTGTGIGNACNPDLNHDGIVNAQDLALFKIAYAAYNSSAHTYNPNADFNGDGKIDTADLAILEQYLNGPAARAERVRALHASGASDAKFRHSIRRGRDDAPGHGEEYRLSAGTDLECNDLGQAVRPSPYSRPAI